MSMYIFTKNCSIAELISPLNSLEDDQDYDMDTPSLLGPPDGLEDDHEDDEDEEAQEETDEREAALVRAGVARICRGAVASQQKASSYVSVYSFVFIPNLHLVLEVFDLMQNNFLANVLPFTLIYCKRYPVDATALGYLLIAQ